MSEDYTSEAELDNEAIPEAELDNEANNEDYKSKYEEAQAELSRQKKEAAKFRAEYYKNKTQKPQENKEKISEEKLSSIEKKYDLQEFAEENNLSYSEVRFLNNNLKILSKDSLNSPYVKSMLDTYRREQEVLKADPNRSGNGEVGKPYKDFKTMNLEERAKAWNNMIQKTPPKEN